MMITQMDREWAEMVAGREVTNQEILEIKRELEDWIDRNEEGVE